MDFVTGRSISVGFNGPIEALGNLPQALLLWKLNFNWAGLILIAVGLGMLVWRKRWPVLVLTGLYALLQGLFNLFYGIGDILVYYIPLYLMAVIWIGFAAQAIGLGFQFDAEKAGEDVGDTVGETAEGTVVADGATAADGGSVSETDENENENENEKNHTGEQDTALTSPALTPTATVGLIFLLILFLLPLRQLRAYSPQLDQSNSSGTRQRWETILAAEPPADAVLVSNDRNDIVPLFYLQNVEQRGQGMTGLFPLIMPGQSLRRHRRHRRHSADRWRRSAGSSDQRDAGSGDQVHAVAPDAAAGRGARPGHHCAA